jgi:putative ABC transport system permease protein
MRGFSQDLAAAARSLRRSPAVTLAAVATLAVGIGANTAIFSVVAAVLVRPLATPELERLHVVRGDVVEIGLLGVPLAASELLDLAERRDIFEAVSGYTLAARNLTGHGAPIRVATAQTLGDFVGVFGVHPLHGHFHAPAHSLEGPYATAVVSHGLWQQLSGGDPRFVGRTIDLNGIAHEVVGVMPAGFAFPRDAQVWVPFQFAGRFRAPEGRGIWNMTTIVRVRPGVAPAQLAAQLGVEAERWRQEHSPGAEVGKQLHATPLVDYLAGPLRPILLVLLGAVAFVLLIAAANVASLQLVRATGRARELAVRAALGAGRLRLTRQLLFESLLLAAAGGVAGAWLAAICVELVVRWAPARDMHITVVSLDATVLGFTALISLAAAVVFGTVPALRAARVDPGATLRANARGSSSTPSRHRLLQASIAVQVAFALVLLLGSGLMIRTLATLLATDPGFDPGGVTTAQVTIPAAAYDTEEKALAFFDELLERLRARPGVESAAVVWGLPFTDQIDGSPFRIPDRPPAPGDPERQADVRIVSDGYFATMRIPRLRGRDFGPGERIGSPLVAIVDAAFASRYFPGEDPVGRVIDSGYFGWEPTTIIGVVGSVDQEEVGAAAGPVIYYSHRHHAWFPWRSLAVRSTLPAGAVAAMMREIVAGLDADVPLYDVQTMTARVQRSIGPRRLALAALGAFAALALLLAALGIYGVVRYASGERTREIGIRMAIGATAAGVLALVLRQAVVPVGVGLAVGTLAALALARFMTTMLFGVSPHDPLALATAMIVLATTALLAALLPARRAVGVEPMSVLRNE